MLSDLSTDQKAFTKWTEKSEILKKVGFDISVSHLLEEKSTTTQINHGLDIADFFIQNKKLRLGNSEIYNKLKSKNPNLEKLLETFDLFIPYD